MQCHHNCENYDIKGYLRQPARENTVWPQINTITVFFRSQLQSLSQYSESNIRTRFQKKPIFDGVAFSTSEAEQLLTCIIEADLSQRSMDTTGSKDEVHREGIDRDKQLNVQYMRYWHWQFELALHEWCFWSFEARSTSIRAQLMVY